MRSSDFIAKTLAGVTRTVERAVFSEENARRPGLLQRCDARAKVVALLLVLVTTAVTRHLAVLAVLYGVVLVAAVLSRLSFAALVRRVWLGIPFFAGIVALPALFTVAGQPLVELDAGWLRLTITDNGLATAALFVARVGTSVSLAVLLVLTTRWTDLLKALRVVRVPAAFVVVLGMTYRYLFLFLHLANGMFLARQSRTVAAISGAEHRRWAAGAAGSLFGKSVKLSADVHMAMIARGFAGEQRSMAEAPPADRDWLLVSVALVLASGLLLLDRGLR